MSKLLLYHSHSLLSTVLFSCYLNPPVFLSAHTLALKSTHVCGTTMLPPCQAQLWILLKSPASTLPTPFFTPSSPLY